VSFLEPLRLWLLLGVAALLVAYVALQRRRPTYAVRFTELDLLASLVPRSAAWRRHVPAGLLLLSLTALVTAFARPEADVEVPRERATVVVALDTSISMEATDVTPDRISAARESAAAFVAGLPDAFDVGLVSFSGTASVVVPGDAGPRAGRAGRQRGCSSVRAPRSAKRCSPPGSGARGAGGAGAACPARPDRAAVRRDQHRRARGRGGRGGRAGRRGPRLDDRVRDPDGVVEVQGELIPVPVDGPALERLAESTGGSSFTAESGEELAAVYEDIGSQVGTTTERREVTAAVTGVALALGLGAAVASLVWGARLP
jgi:Ca-activated chloride channel family protein